MDEVLFYGLQLKGLWQGKEKQLSDTLSVTLTSFHDPSIWSDPGLYSEWKKETHPGPNYHLEATG